MTKTYQQKRIVELIEGFDTVSEPTCILKSCHTLTDGFSVECPSNLGCRSATINVETTATTVFMPRDCGAYGMVMDAVIVRNLFQIPTGQRIDLECWALQLSSNMTCCHDSIHDSGPDFY
jgi:hypothetical protein